MSNAKNPPPPGINYLYFGLFFALLVFLSVCSVLLKENLMGSRIFFLFYSIGQALMEIALFVFIGSLLRKHIGNFGFYLFIGFTFFCCVVHIVDFILERILDLSVLETVSFVFDESLTNFIHLLEASGISLWLWGVFALLIALIPFIGMALYKATDWIAQVKPLLLPKEAFLQLFVCIPAALLFWDHSASKVVHPGAYTAFVKSLPWKQTFLRPRGREMQSGALKPHLSEQEVRQEIAQTHLAVTKRPPIFLFVVESLREDCITHEIAPHLAQFRNQNIRGSLSLSNANATQLSWFSIFHSQFPFLWKELQRENWSLGSPALALFKQLGYQIRVYSAADLTYYGMDELLFGKERYLADSYQLFLHVAPKEACDADREAMRALKSDLAADPRSLEGQFCIVFLDSTHFNYSWPKEEAPKFTPFGSDISYFRTHQSKHNIELIKNRYRNAVHYVDQLFGEFLGVAPKEAFVAFTGDHGEEFFERGHLFHNSHLIHEQTNVPIYLRINDINKETSLFTQMDIMPTLLDAVTEGKSPLLQGESVLREKVWPFAYIARFNASRSPYEFCIHNGKYKLIAQFLNRGAILESNALEILSLRTHRDESLREPQGELVPWIEREFGPAFDRLFQR